MACTESGAMPAMDHSQMDHGIMEHDDMVRARAFIATPLPDAHGTHEVPMVHQHGSGEGSGTSRLPHNEAMGHGAMIALGGDADLMLHGYL